MIFFFLSFSGMLAVPHWKHQEDTSYPQPTFGSGSSSAIDGHGHEHRVRRSRGRVRLVGQPASPDGSGPA